MADRATEYITREGAELMFTQMLAEYEKQTVEPRHRETQRSLQEVLTLVSRGKGWRDATTVIFAAAGVFWTCVQVYSFFRPPTSH